MSCKLDTKNHTIRIGDPSKALDNEDVINFSADVMDKYSKCTVNTIVDELNWFELMVIRANEEYMNNYGKFMKGKNILQSVGTRLYFEYFKVCQQYYLLYCYCIDKKQENIDDDVDLMKLFSCRMEEMKRRIKPGHCNDILQTLKKCLKNLSISKGKHLKAKINSFALLALMSDCFQVIKEWDLLYGKEHEYDPTYNTLMSHHLIHTLFNGFFYITEKSKKLEKKNNLNKCPQIDCLVEKWDSHDGYKESIQGHELVYKESIDEKYLYQTIDHKFIILGDMFLMPCQSCTVKKRMLVTLVTGSQCNEYHCNYGHGSFVCVSCLHKLRASRKCNRQFFDCPVHYSDPNKKKKVDSKCIGKCKCYLDKKIKIKACVGRHYIIPHERGIINVKKYPMDIYMTILSFIYDYKTDIGSDTIQNINESSHIGAIITNQYQKQQKLKYKK